MPITLDSTPGSPTANTYVVRSDVDLVAPFRPGIGTAWTAAADTPDVQSQAILLATRRIDQLRYVGAPTNDDQALEFPRMGLTDKNGRAIDPETNPAGVIDATISLSMFYVAQVASGADPFTTQAQSVKSATTPTGASVEFFAPAPIADPVAWNDTADLPADVVRVLAPYLAPDPATLALASGWGSARAIRAS